MAVNTQRLKYVLVLVLAAVVAVALLWQRTGEEGPPPEQGSINGVAIQQWTTEKGARVLFVPTPQLPMVDIRILFDAGSARDGDASGLARLTSILLDHGAGEWDTNTIAARFEDVGAQFGTGARRDMASVSLRSLTEPELLEQALATMQAVLQQPRFEESELERERRRMLIGLQNELQSPASIAERRFYATLYGTHPYAAMPSGTPETVGALTVKQVRDFYRRYYVARNATVAIVGALDREQAESIAARLMDGLAEGEAAPALPTPPPLDEAVAGETIHVAYPSAQSHIRMGALGVFRGDPDYFPLYVGNHILGGSGFSSRIVEEIREERGLAYSSYSYFLPMRVPGPFVVGMQTRDDQTGEALALLKKTITDFVAQGPTPEELAHAKKNITGGFPLRVDSNSDIVGYIGMIGFYRLPLDYLQTFNEKVEAVTLAQIRDAFGRRVDVAGMATVVVGKTAPTPPPAAEPGEAAPAPPAPEPEPAPLPAQPSPQGSGGD